MRTFVRSLPHLIGASVGIGAVAGLAATTHLTTAALGFIASVVGVLLGASAVKLGSGSTTATTPTSPSTTVASTVSRQN